MRKQDYAIAGQRRTYLVELVPLSVEDTFVPTRHWSIQVDSALYVAHQLGMTLPPQAWLRRAAINECISLAKRTPGTTVHSTPVLIGI